MNTEIANLLEKSKREVVAARKIQAQIERMRTEAEQKKKATEQHSLETQAKKNRALIVNAQRLLRYIFTDPSMKKFMSEHVGSKDNSYHFEGEIYITLAEFCEPQEIPEEGGFGRIIGGRHLMKKGFQLVLRIYKSQETGLDLDNLEIEYCLYSMNELCMEDWMDTNPVYLSVKIRQALVALQTKESAIRLLVRILTDEKVPSVSVKASSRPTLPKKVLTQLLAKKGK